MKYIGIGRTMTNGDGIVLEGGAGDPLLVCENSEKGFKSRQSVISTERALRLPATYDNHPSDPSTYSCEDLI